MKKLISLILALALVMGLAVGASAASITITAPGTNEGTEAGITYQAYKVFDAHINGTKMAYSIDRNNPYFETVDAAKNYFTLTQVPDSTTYTVTVKDAYNEAAAKTFAATLAGVTADPAGTVNSNKISNLSDGYYLVTSSAGSALILDTIGDITIESKNAYPSISKIVDQNTSDKGGTRTFTITVTIPETADGKIVVHDEMTDLTYVSMTAVEGITAANQNLEDACAVEFTLSESYVAANLGQDVQIEYTATFNSDAIAVNTAWLVDDTFTSKKVTVEILTTDIVIDKIDKSDNSKLKDAKFVLQNSEDKFYSVYENGKVTWVNTQENATVVTTGTNGAAKFENIADGTYKLVETEAPAGYNLLTAPVEVNVAAAKETTNNSTVVKDITATVENSTGSELPSTGGIGTTLFYVIGGLLMAGAAVLLITKKRMA